MIKAIETRYKGYRFRSRLEARWAVFFDAMGLDWEYEPEGFELSDGRYYLPDFKVTSPQGYTTWYEVKPKSGSDDGKMGRLEKDFMSQFDESQCVTDSFTLLCGDPIEFLGDSSNLKVCPRCGNLMDYDNGSSIGLSGAYYPCWPCDIGTPSGSGDSEIGVNGLTVRPHKGAIDIDFVTFERHSDLIVYACKKARSARFEHGETPA